MSTTRCTLSTWNHFVPTSFTAAGLPKRVSCLHCKRTNAANITRLKKHLATQHGKDGSEDPDTLGASSQPHVPAAECLGPPEPEDPGESQEVSDAISVAEAPTPVCDRRPEKRKACLMNGWVDRAFTATEHRSAHRAQAHACLMSASSFTSPSADAFFLPDVHASIHACIHANEG